MGNQGRFVPFSQFIQDARCARTDVFLELPGARVRDAKAFEEMRSYLLRLYEGITPSHSFVDEQGCHWDAVPVEQQPSARAAARQGFEIQLEAPTPISRPAQEAADAGQEEPLRTPSGTVRIDRFGNSMRCEPGYIPMRRITLEELTRFPTLEDYMSKGGRKKYRPPD